MPTTTPQLSQPPVLAGEATTMEVPTTVEAMAALVPTATPPTAAAVATPSRLLVKRCQTVAVAKNQTAPIPRTSLITHRWPPSW